MIRDEEDLAPSMKRTLKQMRGKLSPRAYNVLDRIVCADIEKRRGRTVRLGRFTDIELLRRAAQVEPALSYRGLTTRVQNCGKVTAKEICKAMNLPVYPSNVSYRVQCPRCMHIFGGDK